jgi:hypothetical protein
MIDTVRYKINAYLQLIKYVDSAEKRNDIIDEILALIELTPYEVSSENKTNISMFLSEKTEKQTSGRIKRKDLYDEYINYCTETRVDVIPKQMFYKMLKDEGYYYKKTMGCEFVIGLTLKEGSYGRE